MATVLHLLKGGTDLARPVIEQSVRAGDRVTVAVLAGGIPLDLPDGVDVHRVPHDLSYDRLLELIFRSDQVITW